ncbi:hypothetical protein C9I86_12565 [Photobacterium sp. NCIMB 13483]|uniref:hypothetical protein n=1 Tax=Photobacterium sp. NCIMB 13483 TaxID=2022103 RepID=UPI000D16CC51|nr:hypothetical protein [Photobacterium sp. NCIMB 13483]PST87565.1 hypothetical protein C9I86_12565 [Photobacterium sp. NCIMB 13483]
MTDEVKELRKCIDSSIVSERNHIFKYTSPLIKPNSSDAKAVYHEYDRATSDARYHNHNVRNIPYGNIHVKEMNVPTFHTFLLNKLRCHFNQKRKDYISSRIADRFKSYDEDGDWEFLIADFEFEGETDHDVFKAWLMFEHLFDISDQIVNMIESKNLIGIEKHLELIDQNFGFLMGDTKLFFQLKMDENELYSWLLTQIDSFKHQVEERDLWRSLKDGPEKHFQRVFESYLRRTCELYDVDISPETSTGGGIVDFKFSQGNGSKICVELKLSQNPNALSGLTHQLTQYKCGEKTDKGIYVVLNSGCPSSSYYELVKYIEEAKSSGVSIDHIILINATGKLSASKLK